MIVKISNVYKKIIEPSSAIQDPIDKLKSQIIARILLRTPFISIIFLLIFSSFIEILRNNLFLHLAIILFMTLINIVILIINKTSFYKFGWLLFLLNIVLAIHFSSYPYSDTLINLLLLLFVPIMLSAIFFDLKITIINTLIIINTIPIIYLLDVNVNSVDILYIYFITSIFGLTIILFLSRMIHEIQDYQTKMILEREELLAHGLKMEAIGRLASGVAHDFNNILTIIRGYTSILGHSIEENVDLEEINNALEEIQNATERAENITRQLLIFTKKNVIQPEIFDINELIIDNSKFIDMLINNTNINYTRSLEADECQLLMDKNQFQQILINLIVNATEAMGNDGLLHISTKKLYVIPNNFDKIYHFESTHYVLVTISDTGVGIKESDLSSIYDPYFTTKKSRIGLGLFTVYKIIMNINGAIKIASQIDKGTEVLLLLPLTVDHLIEIPKTELITQLETDRVYNILIIDDEPQIVKIIKKSLSLKNFEINTAITPFEALDIIYKTEINFDLVISDIVMPDMDGMELMGKITNIQPNVRYLLISGYARDTFFEGIKLDQEFGFLQKPFTLDELRTKVVEILSTSE